LKRFRDFEVTNKYSPWIRQSRARTAAHYNSDHRQNQRGILTSNDTRHDNKTMAMTKKKQAKGKATATKASLKEAPGAVLTPSELPPLPVKGTNLYDIL